MFNCFYPCVRYGSVYDIDFEKYYEAGYRALLFDIDNTLVRHNAPADERSVGLMTELKNLGFKTCLISNNDNERVKTFAAAVGALYICNASKPKPDGYIRAMKLLNVQQHETIMIGDQLFTDMWGANNAGILSVCTKPIAADPYFHIKLKRVGEAVVWFFYRFSSRKRNSKQFVK